MRFISKIFLFHFFKQIFLYLKNRYNNFTLDELSECKCTPPYSAELTIASRCDLNQINGSYPDLPLGHRVHGATDAKVRINISREMSRFQQ
jgi:hypothetical protein